MIKPVKYKDRVAINSLTGIKSSLAHIRSVISLTYLLYLANNRRSSIVYSRSDEAQSISLRPEYTAFIKEYLGDTNIDSDIVSNPLLTSQIESLYVGITLMFGLGRISFENSSLGMTKERTGGTRYPKKIDFASNIVLLDTILQSADNAERQEFLKSWLKDRNIDSELELRIATFLNICIENNLFKLRDGDNDIFFQTEGIYLALQRGEEVSLESDEKVGPARILNSMLREDLIPWLTVKNSTVKINNNCNFDVASYTDILSTSLDIRDIKVDAVEEIEQEDETTTHSSLSLQQIFYGAPGTGKSHIIKEQTKGEDVIRTTFHPDTDYSTFVGTYKPTTEFAPVLAIIGDKAVETGREEKRISYEFVCQAFLQAYVAAWKKVAEAKGSTAKKQFLVIEEINRGNCAQIFGDLFQLLDRNDYGYSDYPIQADADMQKQLKWLFGGVEIENAESINALYDGRDIVKEVLSGEVLLLPNNLYIWATMNTSDQSLFPIDSAFKRRWDWQYMPISEGRDKNGQSKNWKIEADTQMYSWWSFIQKINDEIYDKTNSEDKKLGYYFCKPINGVIKVETFVSKVLFYIWNDVFKDFDNESGIFAEPYDKFYGTDTKGDVVIAKDKVQTLLDNLNVEVAEIIGADENESVSDESDNATMTGSSARDKSVYSINGEGNYVKKTVPLATVTAYVKNYPDVTASELVETWYALGTMIRQIVISKESYEQKLSKTSDAIFAKRYDSLNLPNGEVVYVYNQFTPERINDFISKVNEQSWDIHIEKVAE